VNLITFLVLEKYLVVSFNLRFIFQSPERACYVYGLLFYNLSYVINMYTKTWVILHTLEYQYQRNKLKKIIETNNTIFIYFQLISNK
jgi:hypothetical protein